MDNLPPTTQEAEPSPPKLFNNDNKNNMCRLLLIIGRGSTSLLLVGERRFLGIFIHSITVLNWVYIILTMMTHHARGRVQCPSIVAV
ncbi:hypothetical protein Y1Q_0024468 [Alligator mississippiensis]|uniref:Uncharacterized protein n=1 Tax=Alligator mississippiensis TaxID=8496 RepID=A0A151NAH6_ALLMI|nr:hypothetical protein Y1Q_0024468 [Alligator mississippiensis]